MGYRRDMRRLTYGVVGVWLLAACSGSSVVGGPEDGAVADTGVDSGTDLGVADTGPADVGMDAPVDVAPDAPADVPVDTGPSRCTRNEDCRGNELGLNACDVASGRCVACSPADDTCPAGQYCDGATFRCAPGCRNDEGCAPGVGTDGGVAPDAGTATPRCNVSTRTCVACVRDEHCPAGLVCAGNQCVAGCNSTQPCPGGQACCEGACVETASNTAHCGACGTRCNVANAAPVCAMGRCTVGMCTGAFRDCDNDPSNGCEVDAASSVAHCGGCGMACGARPNATARCTEGACAYSCAEGFADCDNDPSNGCEVDTRTSTAHCGACGTACNAANATATCTMGVCGLGVCNAGFGNCDNNAANGCEVDTRTSTAHCGACGTTCTTGDNATATCAAGMCGVACATGFGNCDNNAANGCEVDTRSSVAHCGACGTACPMRPNSTPVCAASACGIVCATGFGDCDSNAANGCETDTRTSDAHCGACGNACAVGSACVAGVCTVRPAGDGRDGELVVTDTYDLAARTRAGRTVADAVSFPVTAIANDSVTVTGTPGTGLAAGDEVLVINLRGTATAFANVGRWETGLVASVSGTTVRLVAPLTGTFGATSNGDLAGQVIVLQRVPQYTRVIVRNGGRLTTGAFDGTRGGVLWLKASERVTVEAGGAIDTDARGFRGGAAGGGDGTGGRGGECYALAGGNGGATTQVGQPGAGNGDGAATPGPAGRCAGGGGGDGTGNSDDGAGGGGGGGHGGGGGGGGGGSGCGADGSAGGLGGTTGIAAGGGGASTCNPGDSSRGGNGGNAGAAGGTATSNSTPAPPYLAGAAGTGATSGQGGGGTTGTYYGGGGGGGGGLVGDSAFGVIVLGSGGAGGGGSAFATPGGAGGAGGGVVSLVSPRIEVAAMGRISANGANGEVISPRNRGGCGGSGAGGSVRLRASALTLMGTVSAQGAGPVRSGGSGGGGGGVGRVRAEFETVNGQARGSSGANTALGTQFSPAPGSTGAGI